MATYEQIISELSKKIYKPIYFLMGEEAYYIDLISNYILNNVLEPHEKDFNQTVLYGKDTDITTVITAARRFPMMANYQVLMIKEAQDLKKFEDVLAKYVESPLKSTILVFCYKYGKADQRKKVYKEIDKMGVLFNSEKIKDYKIPEWINKYLAEKKVAVDSKGCQILAESLGNDLSKISNELEKLIITLPENNKKITPEHIEKNIGISKDYNPYELSNALLEKNVLKANRIVNYFANNSKNYPLVMIIPAIFNSFVKLLKVHSLVGKDKKVIASELEMNPFFVDDFLKYAKNYSARKIIDVISIVREYDLKSKGVDNASTTDGELMKEMVFRILH
jgi:DNA polymerase-3 subunit delta